MSLETVPPAEPGRRAGTPVADRANGLHWFAGRFHEVLDELGSPASWSMTQDEVTETLADLASGMARIQGLFLGLVGDADRTDLASAAGATNTAALLGSLTRMPGPAASRTVKTARAMEAHPATRDALGSGSINLDQAQVILHAVDALPDGVGALDRSRAEAHLLGEAASHDARVLRRLGAHLLEVLDPDAADQALADKLEREERNAARKSFLELRDRGDGTHDLKGRLGTLHRAMLERYLGALLNPDRPDPIDRDGTTRPEQYGAAFGQLLERYPAKNLPTSGGVSATVVVTLTLESLLGGLKAASLDTGEPISAAMARRLACAAGIIPAVLGSDSEVLDLGRKVRFHTPKQRLAMSVQQGGACAVDGCDRPAWWCDGHHLTAWSDHGDTSVEEGVLICPRHHTLAHQPRFTLQRQGHGRVRLVRRQ